ncbi:YigZ family protein [Konateibacter massiliensis]|uniref:YigZ family protein n=1 Tax=Konateibacter massiliensis TaxID=2002841 RepID=UPI000C15737E|nr:YigZ family protein [Konateibacter massiliensis]
MEYYKAVYEGGEGEIQEKKSRFIATVFPIQSEEEAITHIESTKKKYWDARHNCFAYVLGTNQEIQRCSDDGEPSQTAGKPILDVLLGEGLRNTLVVVTRYFGGTLLGTGGLVRAYFGATQEGLRNSVIAEKYYAVKLAIGTDYNGVGKIQYLLGQRQITILSSEYTDVVKITALVPIKETEGLRNEIIEATNGKAELEEAGTLYFAKINGEVICFEE